MAPDHQPGAPAGRGLTWKVFAYTFPMIAAIVLLTQATVGYFSFRERLTGFEARSGVIARLTAQALSRPLWNLDRPVFQAQMAAVAQDANFLYARLTGERGQVLLELGTPPADPDRAVSISAPVMDPTGASRIGAFQLAMSTAHLVDNARRQIWIGLSACVALLVGFLITLNLVVRRLVQRPLDRLLAAMSRVERKDWVQVDWRGGDEIGQVTAAFNRMVDSLKSGDEAKRLLAELEKAQRSLLEKNQELDKANRLIMDSIHYARRIQTAMLPDKAALGDAVADLHVCWEPLHLVGGDYFWLERFGNRSIMVIMDCTGHGVPGAFMTLVAASALDRILHEHKVHSPSAVLTMLDQMVRERLRQDRPDSDSDDGLEAAVCLWDRERRELVFSGAGLPLIMVRDGQATVVKGDRAMLGYRTQPPRGGFTDHRLAIEPGTSCYLITDGVPDHMGEQSRRLLGRRRLVQMILEVQGIGMDEQLARLELRLNQWRGVEPRRDDMTLIGFRPL